MPLDFLFPEDEILDKKIEDGVLHIEKEHNETPAETKNEPQMQTKKLIPIDKLNKAGDRRGMHNGNRGRTKGARNLLPSERIQIGIEAHFDTAENVAAKFGVNPQQVQLARNGKTTGAGPIKEELAGPIQSAVEQHLTKFERRRSKILNESSRKLLEIMGLITKDETRSNPKDARIFAGIAKDLAIVTEKIEKKAGTIKQKNYSFQIFTPPEMSEEEFGEPIEVQAKVVND